MDKKNKNPEIRFKGFTEDWEPDDFGSLFSLENGFAFKSEFFQDDKSNLIVLTPGNVNIGGGFKNGKGQYYNPKGEFSSKFLFNPDDIFVTMTDLTPTGQTLGFPAIVPNDGIIYLHNQRLGKLVNYKCDKIFLFHLLCNPNIQKQIVQTSSGTTVKHTSPNKILNTKTSFPKPTEQKQIGLFFQNLDNLIALHQKKYDKLVILKKAMLVKMFPKNGSLVPEIRFKGFSDEWEVESLGKIAKITTGKSNREDSSLEGEYTFFDRSEEIRKSDIYLFDCEAIIIAGEGSDFIPKYFNGKFDLHQRTYAIINSKDIDGRFLQYQIHLFRKYFLDQAVGSTVKSLRLPMFLNMPIKFPSKTEQQKIGSYFKNLDNQIELHKTQLDKLNTIKKACFSKMFVGQD